MKVVIVTDYAFVNGGAGKVALDSAIALADQVDHVYVFSAVGEIAESLKGRDRLTVVSLGQSKVTERPAKEVVIGGLWNREAAEAFCGLLSGLDRSDTVVHVHSWRDALTASPIATAMELGFKVALTCHDFGVACPIAGFFDERNRTICVEKALGLTCLAKSCTGGSFVKKSWFVARHAIQVKRGRIPRDLKHVIFVSEFSRRIIEPYLPKGIRSHHVNNPICVERMPKASPAEHKSLIYVGRFSSEKGPDVAAVAAHKVGSPIRFVGVGPMSDKIQELNPEAELMGWRTPQEVSEILRSSRALVFPSIWYETQGMVVNEAAAHGIPVIVSDCTAAVDTVKQLGHGLTFKAGSADDLAEKIKELDSDELVNRLSVSGYESYWESPPTVDAHTSRLLEVYSEVLSG